MKETLPNNEIELLCKFALNVACTSHDNETMIIKMFFLHKFPLPPNKKSLNGYALE